MISAEYVHKTSANTLMMPQSHTMKGAEDLIQNVNEKSKLKV